MNSIYIALEALSIAIMAVMLFANIFELKTNSRKKKVFSFVVSACIFLAFVDLFTWTKFDWNKVPVLFWILNFLTYLVPVIILVIFIKYIEFLISEKTPVKKSLFFGIFIYLGIGVIATIAIGATGLLFSIEDGVFKAGPGELYYFIIFLVAEIMFVITICMYAKKLGKHDFVAALLFCATPLISTILSAVIPDFVLTIPLLSVDVLVIYVFLQSDNQNKLLADSNIDRLTGLYNRRAYDNERAKIRRAPVLEKFTFASIDLNGLKEVNDTIGHQAGDELLKAAASILQDKISNYGKVYRIGGDEFVAMFHADEIQLAQIIDDIEEESIKWEGKFSKDLSFALGTASKREFKGSTVTNLAKIADERMYRDKERYYSTKGIDRRGMSEAHKAMTQLYIKILRVNLTTDTFSIISMDKDALTRDRTYSNKISEWLKNFGDYGNIREDDIQRYRNKTDINYLREYFKRDKRSLAFSYHRRYGRKFKKTVFEMIPTKEYTDDNQILFLYVKCIDR